MVKDRDAQADEDGGIGARVRAARTAAGLTLEQVSSRIGVSPATLSLIERNKVSVTVERLTGISEVFGVALDDLMSGSAASADAEATAPGGREETMPKVLGAAIDCFTTWGYHGTSMRQIAHAADVSVAGVYHYYESKQQMLVAILDSTMGKLIARLEEKREEIADRPPEERFRILVETLAYDHATKQRTAFIGASEMRSIEEPDRTRIAGMRSAVQYMIDAEARAAAEAGAFAVPNVEFSCRLVVTMCTALAQWYDPTGPVGPDAAAASVADSAVAMLSLDAAG